MVSLQDFYSIWAPHGRKLRNGLFDRNATKWYFWPACDQNLDSVLLRSNHGSNSQNFDRERLRTLTPMVPKVSLHDLLPILAAPRPKIISIRSFWPRCDQMGQIFKFFHWREYFTPELDANGRESFPPGFFTHFGRPIAKNFDSVFLKKFWRRKCVRRVIFWNVEVRVERSEAPLTFTLDIL